MGKTHSDTFCAMNLWSWCRKKTVIVVCYSSSLLPRTVKHGNLDCHCLMYKNRILLDVARPGPQPTTKAKNQQNEPHWRRHATSIAGAAFLNVYARSRSLACRRSISTHSSLPFPTRLHTTYVGNVQAWDSSNTAPSGKLQWFFLPWQGLKLY